MQRAQFKHVAPFLIPWLVPDMRHNRDEAMFIYETLSYTLATFSLLQRKENDLVRYKSFSTACAATRSSCFWTAINHQLGKINRMAWRRYTRVREIYGLYHRDLKRPARRKLLRLHLWTRNEENRFDIFWEQTMILRGKWRPNFAEIAAKNELITSDSEGTPVTVPMAHHSRFGDDISFTPTSDLGPLDDLSFS